MPSSAQDEIVVTRELKGELDPQPIVVNRDVGGSELLLDYALRRVDFYTVFCDLVRSGLSVYLSFPHFFHLNCTYHCPSYWYCLH